MQQNAPVCVLLKKKNSKGGGDKPQTPLPLLDSRGLACMHDLNTDLNNLSTKLLSLHCVWKEINLVVCLTCVFSKFFSEKIILKL